MFLSACAKGPRWWYTFDEPKGDFPTDLTPQAGPGFKIDRLVSLAAMRELLDGRVMSVGKNLAAIGEGDALALYWLTKMRRYELHAPRPQIPAGQNKLRYDDTIFSLFRWSADKGLQLLIKDLPIILPHTILANQHATKTCPVGAPLVFGVLEKYRIADRRKGRPAGATTFGKSVTGGICITASSETTDTGTTYVALPYYQYADPMASEAMHARFGPKGRLWLSFSVADRGYLDDQGAALTERRTHVRVLAVDLVNGKETVYFDWERDRKMLATFRSFEWIGHDLLVGLGSYMSAYLCRVDLKGPPHDGPPPYVCGTFKPSEQFELGYSAFAVAGGSIESGMSNPFYVGASLQGRTRQGAEKSIYSGRVIRLQLPPAPDDLRRKWYSWFNRAERRLVAEGFYVVQGLAASGNDLFVAESGGFRRYGNHIYRIRPMKK